MRSPSTTSETAIARSSTWSCDGAAAHFHRLRELAGLERRIDDDVGADLQDDIGLREGAEALERRLQAVRPGFRFGNA